MSPPSAATIYLGFHGLGQPGHHVLADERPYWIDHVRFREILDEVAVANTHCHIGITFDDGNASDCDVALPLLAARGLKASFFVVANRIGTKHYLSKGAIRELEAAGMAIGSHGHDHVKWTGLATPTLEHHVRSSLQKISDIVGRPVTEVGIPFGAYNRRVASTLRRLGVTRAYTSDFGPAVRGSWLVARNTVRVDTAPRQVSQLVSSPPTFKQQLRARARLWRRSLLS